MIVSATRSARFALVGLSLAIVGLAGCTSTELQKDPAKVERRGAGTVPDPSATQSSDSSGVSGVAPVVVEEKDPLQDPNSPLAKRSIYFQYDSFVVQPEFQPVVETHARYLTTNKNRRVVIEGNTDERGSREYNLALGQKRADAVRRALATLGVEDAQMESISFGEEKPRALTSDESSMAENRRADLNYR
jgi:peptidoglycan-associated lipoprotein